MEADGRRRVHSFALMPDGLIQRLAERDIPVSPGARYQRAEAAPRVYRCWFHRHSLTDDQST